MYANLVIIVRQRSLASMHERIDEKKAKWYSSVFVGSHVRDPHTYRKCVCDTHFMVCACTNTCMHACHRASSSYQSLSSVCCHIIVINHVKRWCRPWIVRKVVSTPSTWDHITANSVTTKKWHVTMWHGISRWDKICDFMRRKKRHISIVAFEYFTHVCICGNTTPAWREFFPLSHKVNFSWERCLSIVWRSFILK